MQVETTIHGLKEINEKVDRLVEIMKEANTLAGELASYEITISSSSEVVK